MYELKKLPNNWIVAHKSGIIICTYKNIVPNDINKSSDPIALYTYVYALSVVL